jgi:DNA-binding SARP family transcriptional activator/TolB-like protein
MQRAANLHELAERESTPASDPAACLSVSLVGRFTLRFKGRLIELRTQKAGAVLSYLALTETKHESRERLVGLLWSRSDEERARASLRQVVRELRSVFEDAGCSGFVASRLSIHLDAQQIEVDVDSVIRAAESGEVHPLLLNTPRLGERILEGMDDLDPSFRVWVLAKRQTIYEALMRSLGVRLAAPDIAARAKNRIAAAIVNLDPTHEEACCHLMRMHAQDGDVAGALRIYKALWYLLDRDYGMEPSPATEELVARIKLGAFEKQLPDSAPCDVAEMSSLRAVAGNVVPLAGAEKASSKIRLVLRPFVMHGVDGDHAYLVQGFNQYLVASLVRFREWSVVDRAAAAIQPQGSAPQYCIETAAYQTVSGINIVMVLRDDTTGTYVWSESFRLSLNDWFEAQHRVIRRIVMSLNVQLIGGVAEADSERARHLPRRS